MPWMETCVMDERRSFVAACLDGAESVSALCRIFGISRKTGHKWLARYRGDGVIGLEERSRAPHGNPRAMGLAVIEAVLAVRLRYPNWGPEKVKAYLERQAPERLWPSASSMGRQFARAGLFAGANGGCGRRAWRIRWRSARRPTMSGALTSRAGL